MLRPILFFIIGILFLFSCKKDHPQASISGQWTWVIQYRTYPPLFETPQSTGIQEKLSFNDDGTYAVTQNNSVVNSGTYTTGTATNPSGETVLSILYSNSRVTDSLDYYELPNGNDSLFFMYDLIGTVGSGSRHYGR
ncbi:MAG: hypothetical protein ABI402_09835 [Ferruginibacter sp.]